MKKRWIPLLLTLLMAVSLFGMTACQSEEPAVSGSSMPGESSTDSTNDVQVTEPSAGSTQAAESGSSTQENSGSPAPTTKRTESTGKTTSKPVIDKDDAEEIIKELDLKGATIKILSHLDANGNDARELKTRFKEYCNGNLVFVTQPYEQLGEKLSTMIMSNDSPDIYSLRNWDFPALMYKDVFQELDSKIDFSSKEWAGDMPKYDQYLWQGKHYVIGGASPSYYVWYNKSLMEEYGIDKDPGELAKEGNWTWDTFLQLARDMTDAASEQYGFVDNGGGIMYAFMSGLNVDLIKLTDSGIESNVKSPEVARAINFYGDLFNQYKVTYQSKNAVQDFANRKAAMLYDGHWIAQNDPIKSMHDSGEISFTHIPKVPGSDDYIYPGSVGGYAIPKGAKNIEGAVAFLTMGQVSKAYEEEENARWQKANNLTDAEMAIVLEARDCVNLPTYSYGINEASQAFWDALNNLRGGSSWSSLTAALEPKVLKAIDDLSK